MKELVFLLEEESAKALLVGVLPRLLSPDAVDVHPQFIVFEGKQDLDRQIKLKLRGYLNKRALFIILRDQDREDCRAVKRSLARKCTQAGRPNAVVCIACRELEAFYLGDLLAVEKALGISGLANKQRRARYRDPDQIERPADELERITNKRYHKVAGSRAIAPHLDLDTPISRSFGYLIRSIRNALKKFVSAAN